MSEVRLTKDDDETRERQRDYDKRHETNNVEKVREETEAGKNDNPKDNHSGKNFFINFRKRNIFFIIISMF